MYSCIKYMYNVKQHMSSGNPGKQSRRARDRPEGTKRATSVNVQLLRLQKDLRTGSTSRDVVNFPSNRSGMLTEVAHR